MSQAVTHLLPNAETGVSMFQTRLRHLLGHSRPGLRVGLVEEFWAFLAGLLIPHLNVRFVPEGQSV